MELKKEYTNLTTIKYTVTINEYEYKNERNIVIDSIPNSIKNSITDEEINSKILRRIFDDFIPKAVESSKKFILSEVRIIQNKIQFSQKNIIFSFEAETLPEITMPEITSIHIDVEEPLPDPREFQHAANILRRKHADIKEIMEKRLPTDGDVLRLDINAETDGRTISSMSKKDFTMILHPMNQEPDIVENLVRKMFPGETRTYETVIPHDHSDPTLRGRDLRLSVHLKGIYQEKLPDFDEHFAASLGFKSLDKLKKALFEHVMGEKIKNIQSRAQLRLVESLVAPLKFPIPETILRQNMDDCTKEAKTWLRSQNRTDQETADALNSMAGEIEAQARERARIQTFLLALAFREKITLTQEETDQLILKIAEQTKQDYAKLHDSVMKSRLINELQHRLLANKALEYLYKKAGKTVVDSHGTAVPIPQI